jgi:hypothetical protein
MQLMTWPLARLGSRFGLLFDPQRRRVMHSGLGRFFDEPLDLSVGMIDPQGRERVLPLTPDGRTLLGCEQFERINSITFRGHCANCGVRFELNVHSPFYPRDESLCLLPVFYLELRLIREPRLRLRRNPNPPGNVRLFIRLKRPDTQITHAPGRIDLSYDVPLFPRYQASAGTDEPHGSTDRLDMPADVRRVRVVERIQSLNDDAAPSTDEQGRVGLTLDLPVTDEGSGIKWRLIWASHIADPVMDDRGSPAKLRYNRHWPDVDAVMSAAVANRDDNLAHSRRFEKLLEQAPLDRAQWHLLVLTFQSWLSNTFWCDRPDGSDLLAIWDGNFFEHNRIDALSAQAPLLLSLWPDLLEKLLEQAAALTTEHKPSEGLLIAENAGWGLSFGSPATRRSCPVEHNAQFLLLLGAHAHITGHTALMTRHSELIRRLGSFLLWADRDESGLVSQGTVSSIEDSIAALRRGPHQTYLSIMRACGLMMAGDMLSRLEVTDAANVLRTAAADAVPKIESETWIGDHYSVCVDRSNAALLEAGEEVPLGVARGWQDYSIHTTQALLLPALTAQPLGFDLQRLRLDMASAHRETLGPYGCTHTSSDLTNLSISLNLWRDFVARYIHADVPMVNHRYWDLQLYSNTELQCMGYADRYVGHEMAFGSRGAAAMGYFFAGPRLQLDRLDGEFFAVDPDRHHAQRWPLLALADWAASKVPICVVDSDGRVRIEGGIEPVRVLGTPTSPGSPQSSTPSDDSIG